MKNWTKKISLYDENGVNIIGVIEREIMLQKISSSYGFTPKILSTYCDDKYYYIEMENLNSMCVADKYGEEPEDIPKQYWKQMKNIIQILYKKEGIEYIDITPYNFIEKNDKVYLIDFGHAYLSDKTLNEPQNWFLKDFLSNKKFMEFNPDFK